MLLSDYAQSVAESGDPDAPEMIRLDMRTVSLDEHTEATRAILGSTNSEAFSYSDYFIATFSEFEISWEPMSSERQEAEKQLIQRPDYGRWTWETSSPCHTFGEILAMINDSAFQVTMILWEFLHHFKNSKDISERREIWIDALSIN
ncbi:hypothetical protein BDZ45DRAFT_755310 [Acephala macrosclerotiorum]|nr:hypothetical protein BDZ45DRAFT_755310 [Acephala macrosclerotiorum]